MLAKGNKDHALRLEVCYKRWSWERVSCLVGPGGTKMLKISSEDAYCCRRSAHCLF